MTYLAFIFEYVPPGLVLTKESTRAMIEQADFCVFAPPGGIPIGTRLTVGPDMLSGQGKSPRIGSTVRCTGHMHKGKVVMLEDDSS